MYPNPQKKRRYPFKKHLRRKLRRFLYIFVAVALSALVNHYQSNKTSDTQNNDVRTTHTKDYNHPSNKYFTDQQQQQAVKKIKDAQNNTSARFWVGLNAKIVHKLKDDLSGSRHQKFIISPVEGLTLLVSHNIDLAERVKINKGDEISLLGRYEWNNRGGVIHWTHHDPRGKKEGGWIRANNQVYR